MEDKHRRVLNRNLAEFTKNLNPSDIVPYLISKDIFSYDDNQRLEGFNTLTRRVIEFIRTLQRKGPQAFQFFLEALREHPHYEHLVLKVNDCLQEYDKVQQEIRDKWQWLPMNDYQRAALDQCSESLQSDLPFEAACNYFRNVGFLEKEDIACMKKLHDQSSQSSILLSYVKGRGKVAYELLLDFLRKENPHLETELCTAQEMMEKKVEQFHRQVTFDFKDIEIEDYPDVPHHLNIILIGKTGSGKSATGNRILGKKGVFLEVPGITSGTMTVQKETTNIHGFEIDILDTPGLFDTTSTLRNEDIILEIMKTTEEFSHGVHLFLFVYRGDVRFTDEEMTTFNEMEKYFGEGLLKHCLLVMTHADIALEEATFKEYLQRNNMLHTILTRTCGKAIAVENDDKNVLISTEMKRDQLIHAIVDVVSCNKGQPYSSSIFEATRIELELESKRSKIHEKINEVTFNFLVFFFPVGRDPAQPFELTKADVDMIAKNLSDEERSFLPSRHINRMIKIYFGDCKEFLNLLLQNTKEDQELVRSMNAQHPEKDLPNSILHYVVECVKSLNERTIHHLKTGERLPENEYIKIINESPFPKSATTNAQQFKLITKYIDILVDALQRHEQRRKLIQCVHCECYHVIMYYFRMKSYTERNSLIYTFIMNGFIPPDLYCKCLQVIPGTFKSDSSWDCIIEGVLFQTLLDRVMTENSILQSLIKLMREAKKILDRIFKYWWNEYTTVLTLAFVKDGMKASYRAMIKAWEAFSNRTYTCDPISCKECNGRHPNKNFRPKEITVLQGLVFSMEDL